MWQVHAYAAMSSHGASELYFATGTTGLRLGYRKKPPRPRHGRPGRPTAQAAAAAAQAAQAAPQQPEEQRGVANEEYRDILGGTGAFSQQRGLLAEMGAIFAGKRPSGGTAGNT